MGIHVNIFPAVTFPGREALLPGRTSEASSAPSLVGAAKIGMTGDCFNCENNNDDGDGR